MRLSISDEIVFIRPGAFRVMIPIRSRTSRRTSSSLAVSFVMDEN